jgi:hypothetical protein
MWAGRDIRDEKNQCAEYGVYDHIYGRYENDDEKIILYKRHRLTPQIDSPFRNIDRIKVRWLVGWRVWRSLACSPPPHHHRTPLGPLSFSPFRHHHHHSSSAKSSKPRPMEIALGAASSWRS